MLTNNSEYIPQKIKQNDIVKARNRVVMGVVMMVGLLASTFGGYAQEKNLVQIKAFDQQMAPMQGISVSINGKEFIAIEKKAVFSEILKDDLPPKFIKVLPDRLEAESWNYSKGTLEIIIRKKLFTVIDITLIDERNRPIPNLGVQFKGKKTIDATTNARGTFPLPLALDETIGNADQFAVSGYRAVRITGTGKERNLVVALIPQKQEAKEEVAPPASLLANFRLEQLDSIQSLTVFYAIFKNIDLSSLDDDTRRKVDEKFFQLVNQLSTTEKPKGFIGKISDSSFVKNDVANLLAQAKLENTLLDNFRSDFDEKIKIINEKLAGGASSLGSEERNKLLSDLNMLEQVLRQNEDKFYKNISDYRMILSSLKASFSNIQNLEDKLSLSEQKRLEEQKAFRNRILMLVSISVVFAVLVILLILLRTRLQKQKKNLERANAEVTRVNTNLEQLVFERTRLLIDAHQEMDIFLYRASHDLRSPICSIIGLCNIALHSQDGSHELIKKISDTALKMDGMLKKLRMISEINQPSNYSTIHLCHNVNRITALFGDFIDLHNIDVQVDCSDDLKFESYPDVLEIILYNLIDNALFFSSVRRDRQPRVAIQANVKNNVLELVVYDNGIGIDEQVRIKLWDMFFVGHEHSKGNGLGLYIVFKSVQALNGKIDVQTETNKFTRFVISLPINTRETATLSAGRTRAALVEAI